MQFLFYEYIDRYVVVDTVLLKQISQFARFGWLKYKVPEK